MSDNFVPIEEIVIRVNSKLGRRLQEIAERQSVSLEEAARRSIDLEYYIQEALKPEGTRLLLEKENSIEEVILPW